MDDAIKHDGAGKKEPPSLEEFSQRLDAKRREAEPEAPKASGAAWGRALRTSSELLAGLLVGGFLGFGLDFWLGTKPLFLLVGIAVGFAAGVRNIMRTLKEENEKLSGN